MYVFNFYIFWYVFMNERFGINYVKVVVGCWKEVIERLINSCCWNDIWFLVEVIRVRDLNLVGGFFVGLWWCLGIELWLLW